MKTNIKNTIRILPLLLLSQISTQALGQVNIKDGSFEKSYWSETSPGAVQDVSRHYHSRSLYNGYFGFGWCSELETSLDTSQDRLLTLKDCRLGSPLTFEKIYKHTYVSAALPDERITYKNGIFTRYVGGKPGQRFDPAGKLTSLMNKKGQSRILAYDKLNKLSAITDFEGQIYIIKMDILGQKIIELAADKNKFKYIYHGDDLIEVQKSGTRLYRYEYDQMHNLTKLISGTDIETLRYNTEKDLVTQYTDHKKCDEFYQYTNSVDDPLNHTFATAQRVCPESVGEKNKSVTYEFFHKTHSEGFRYLSRVVIKGQIEDKNLKALEMDYSPYTGLPLTPQTRRIANDEK